MNTTAPSMEETVEQLALDVISLAITGGMPETYWASDSRVARACAILNLTVEEARTLPGNVHDTGLPLPAPVVDTSLPPWDLADEELAALTPTPKTGPLEVWTDGACSPNPGPGGWGWVSNEAGERMDAPQVLDAADQPIARFRFGGEAVSTNQRMEIQAALEALTAIEQRPIVVVSDSSYVVTCFTKFWWKGWLRRGWTNAQGAPVANRDLWERLVPLATEILADGSPAVTFRWVKGHAGNALNEAADRLAVAGRIQSAAGGSLSAEEAYAQALASAKPGRPKTGPKATRRGRRSRKKP
jgi:ribonuclease HI